MSEKTFEPGRDRVLYTKAVYGEEEIQAVVEALRAGWLGPGKYTAEFERKVAELFGKKFGLFVNSGSSANWLAMEIAGLPRGAEVITQACTFPATLNPIIKLGLVPVLVDARPGSYNIDLDQVEQAISENTKAIFISHLVGNVNDMARLCDICNRHGLLLIEDACDTMGCRYAGKPTGAYSDITTASFYAAHNMTAAGAGGMVLVDDERLYRRAQILNDWGRVLPYSFDENIEERFAVRLDHTDMDGKSVYVEQGYNFKPVEIQAAFGLVQLKKLPEFNQIRARNFRRLQQFFRRYERHFILPEVLPDAEAYFLAFPLTLRSDSRIDRKHLTMHLENQKIQTRPLFSGNILEHPAYQGIQARLAGPMATADLVLRRGFLIGCHHGMTDEMLDYVEQVFSQYLAAAELKLPSAPLPQTVALAPQRPL